MSHFLCIVLSMAVVFPFQLNSFQAVIITDGAYAFAMFNYPKDGIQWSAPASV